MESSLPIRPAGTPRKLITAPTTRMIQAWGGNSRPIAGAEGEEDDNPLPQSDATPDRCGVADDQGQDVPVCKDRAKVEPPLELCLGSGISARQRRPGEQDAGGTEDAGDNKGATPAQQRTDTAEQERQ